ncbi:MAG: response regulator [Chloroflexi bacterium]|nr:response regulator [Chloroflexota bacterium]
MPDRILIVDDDLGVATLCERLLKLADYDVESAHRPHDALRMLQARRYDLMLLDIRLPDMNGFELLQLARERDPELAIVIITGHGTVDTAVEALQHGAEGLVLKPFESGDKLVQSVRDALSKSRQASEAARSRALRPLFEVSQLLLAEVDTQRLQNLIVSLVQGRFGASCAALYVVDGEALQMAASQGFPAEYPQIARVGPNAGLPGRAVAWSLPLWVTIEMPGDPSLLRDLQLARLNSALCAPLTRRGQPTGVIVVGKSAEAGAFREGDLELLTILAGQAAAAMENARLYAELREYVRRIEESQQQLVQAEKLAALGRLVGSIAHEVNNPLQAIQNCLHLAAHTGLPEEKRSDYHQLAAEEVDRLIQTVRQMLDFYRPGTIDFTPANLNSLLDEVLALAAKQLRDNQIKVEKNYDSTLPAVPVVRNSLKQVFLNLLLNASEVMPGGGCLTLQTGLAHDGPGGLAQVSFTDTGPGIPIEDQVKLFEPFFTTKDRGTGLGLAVSYTIVEAHRGRIEVDSTLGAGATFTVYLPLERETK